MPLYSTRIPATPRLICRLPERLFRTRHGGRRDDAAAAARGQVGARSTRLRLCIGRTVANRLADCQAPRPGAALSGRTGARHRWRHLRGAGAGMARARCRHARCGCAASMPPSCTRAAPTNSPRRKRHARRCRPCSTRAASPWRASASTNTADASTRWWRRAAPPMFRRRCLRGGFARAYDGRKRGSWCDGPPSPGHHDRRAHVDPAEQVGDVGIVHADTAVRDEAADQVRLIGAVDGVLAAAGSVSAATPIGFFGEPPGMTAGSSICSRDGSRPAPSTPARHTCRRCKPYRTIACRGGRHRPDS